MAISVLQLFVGALHCSSFFFSVHFGKRWEHFAIVYCTPLVSLLMISTSSLLSLSLPLKEPALTVSGAGSYFLSKFR